jgi:hypothetical protein
MPQDYSFIPPKTAKNLTHPVTNWPSPVTLLNGNYLMYYINVIGPILESNSVRKRCRVGLATALQDASGLLGLFEVHAFTCIPVNKLNDSAHQP